MKLFFEIKYLDIQWYDQNTVTHVTESMLPLDVEYNEEKGIFECETTIYPKAEGVKKGQLAIRFFNKKQGNPYIEGPDGTAEYLKPILDKDTGKTWWIEARSWSKGGKQWHYLSVRTAGTIKFVLQSKPCHIYLGSMDFTADELEKYLADFKSDLWEVILDEQSYVQAEAKENSVGGINEEVIDCFSTLLRHSEKILQTPKVELREIQTLKPRKFVKPVNRTFLELATKTNQRMLTSRASKASYNVPENRYVLFVLERCYRILKQLVILSGNKSNRYLHNVQKFQNQLTSFSNAITIDRDLVAKDYIILRERAKTEYWNRKLQEKLKENKVPIEQGDEKHRRWLVELSGPANQGGFFAKVQKPGDQQWLTGSPQTGWIFIKFGYDFAVLDNCLESGVEYEIHGFLTEKKHQKNTFFHVDGLSQISILGGTKLEKAQQSFEREHDIAISLSKNDWIKKLSPRELEEQEKEKKALRNRIDFYSVTQKLAESIFGAIEPKQKKLRGVIKCLRDFGVKPSSHFPNSMTFVQNPNYQGVHNAYKLLRDITNLADDDLLMSLEEIDSIGLINMPILYERWCAIQIIKVLTEQFRFIPQDNWKYNLIEMVRSNQTDLEIAFSNDKAKRIIRFVYEKTLENGKRPDFVLDLKWFEEKHTTPHVPEQLILDNRDEPGRISDPQKSSVITHKKRFVLDAKFYDKGTFARKNGLIGVIENLYTSKNYSEDNQNPVFVLHPCKTTLPHRVTSQEWGKHSFLGEVKLCPKSMSDDTEECDRLEESLNLPFHQFGGVYLSPIDSLGYNDELQRVMGLFLQYKLEDGSTRHLDSDDVVSPKVCIRCGSTEHQVVPKTDRRGYTSKSRWFLCNECSHFSSYNHCGDCSTRVIKNGSYWTYHAARAIDPINVKCPSCGTWGSW